MQSVFIKLAILLASMLLLFSCNSKKDEKQNIVTKPGNIFGGEESAGSKWRSVVSITGGYGSFCTGVLIRKNIVLTAAHCVKKYVNVPQALRIFVGNGKKSKKTFGDIKISYIKMHPRYGKNGKLDFYFDYAYLILKENAPISSKYIYNVAGGKEMKKYFKVGKKITHVGFGKTEYHFSRNKNEVETTIERVGKREFSAGKDGKSICFGDSGGPSFMKIKGKIRIVGVSSRFNSHITKCGDVANFGRADFGYNWIKSDFTLKKAVRLIEKGKNWRAKRALRKALKYDKLNSEAWLRLALYAGKKAKNSRWKFIRKRNRKKMLKYLNRAINANPYYKEAYMRRGKLYLKAGKKKKANKDFIKALELDPNNKEIFKMLIKVGINIHEGVFIQAINQKINKKAMQKLFMLKLMAPKYAKRLIFLGNSFIDVDTKYAIEYYKLALAISKDSINTKIYGIPPLEHAVQKGNTTVITFLLKHKAKVDLNKLVKVSTLPENGKFKLDENKQLATIKLLRPYFPKSAKHPLKLKLFDNVFWSERIKIAKYLMSIWKLGINDLEGKNLLEKAVFNGKQKCAEYLYTVAKKSFYDTSITPTKQLELFKKNTIYLNYDMMEFWLDRGYGFSQIKLSKKLMLGLADLFIKEKRSKLLIAILMDL